MIKCRMPVIVEGKYDRITLSRILDGTVIETRGFGIYRNKELLEMLDSEEAPEVKLKEFLGHTPMQVCCGAVLGFIVALALG